MRPVVSADDVRAARRRRETRLVVPPDAIVTPLARDEAARWGIDLVVDERTAAPGDASARSPHVATCDDRTDPVERIAGRVLERVPDADPAQVREIAVRLLDRLDR